MSEPEERPLKLVQIPVDREKHRRLKVRAAAAESTISAIVNGLLDDYLETESTEPTAATSRG